MDCTASFLPYNVTNSFSKIVLDYIAQTDELKQFVNEFPNSEIFEKIIAQKTTQHVDRTALVNVLNDSYSNIHVNEKVLQNIDLLLQKNTFTICTAHQPNIFTGHLYFVYKILHTVAMAKDLQLKFPNYNFVPMYYMGSEDADLEELGHINIGAEKLEWETTQKGAVGRMVVDDALLQIVTRLQGEFGNYPFGHEILNAVQKSYTKNKTIQQATLEMVNFLFGRFGIVVLIADEKRMKQQMISVFKEEIMHNASQKIVQKTSEKLAEHYKVQAQGREINLFYLIGDKRERIELIANEKYKVINTEIEFTQQELLLEIENHPEHFSPNVILRGLFQETIMPNIAFIGGGGELAYWLQLKELFDVYKTPFPVLFLRNSFLIQTKKQQEDWKKLGFTINDLFTPMLGLENGFILKNSTSVLNTDTEKIQLESIYTQLKENAQKIDTTLVKHIDALKTKQLNKLTQLNKKLLRAEKRNWNDGIIKIKSIKANLFPNANLQERHDNIIPYYAKYGTELLDVILENSKVWSSEFGVITI
jgi:bacillithiol synthase